MRRVLNYVNRYDGENLVLESNNYFGPEISEVLTSPSELAIGYEPNKKIRDAIEKYAVDHATQYFRNRHYKVTPRGKPYDLLCTRKAEELHVEVKGTRGNGNKVILTANEVQHAHDHKMTALYVMHSVSVRPETNQEVRITGGRRKILNPWRINQGRLKSTQYLYTLPPHKKP